MNWVELTYIDNNRKQGMLLNLDKASVIIPTTDGLTSTTVDGKTYKLDHHPDFFRFLLEEEDEDMDDADPVTVDATPSTPTVAKTPPKRRPPPRKPVAKVDPPKKTAPPVATVEEPTAYKPITNSTASVFQSIDGT